MIGETTFPVDPSAPCAAMADCVRRVADLFAGAGKGEFAHDCGMESMGAEGAGSIGLWGRRMDADDLY